MNRHHTRTAQLSMAAVVICTVAWASFGYAKEESSLLVQEGEQPALVAPALTAPSEESAEALPSPQNPAFTIEQPSERSAKKPFMRPAELKRRVPATTALAVTEEQVPAPEIIIDSPEFAVRPAPPIKYDTDRDARKMFRKSGEVPVVLIVCNPADGCCYEIPICIPGCCAGEEPRMDGGRGLLGRGVVEYCWDCGFRAEIKFRHVLGDVKVEYEGD